MNEIGRLLELFFKKLLSIRFRGEAMSMVGYAVRFIEDNRLAMRRQDGTFEEDIECIVDPIEGRGGIFISNLQAASNPATLQKHRIGAVITAAKGNNLAEKMPPNIEYLYLPAVDSQSFDISQYFQAACELLEEEIVCTNVLVHCMAGVSRSATLVIAFLMRSRSLPFQEAFRLVKRRRKIICPNSAFLQQLQRYETTLTRKVPITPTFQQASTPKANEKSSMDQSTSTSWFAGGKRSMVMEKKEMIDDAQYDARLRQRIQALFLKRGKIGG